MESLPFCAASRIGLGVSSISVHVSGDVHIFPSYSFSFPFNFQYITQSDITKLMI